MFRTLFVTVKLPYTTHGPSSIKLLFTLNTLILLYPLLSLPRARSTRKTSRGKPCHQPPLLDTLRYRVHARRYCTTPTTRAACMHSCVTQSRYTRRRNKKKYHVSRQRLQLHETQTGTARAHTHTHARMRTHHTSSVRRHIWAAKMGRDRRGAPSAAAQSAHKYLHGTRREGGRRRTLSNKDQVGIKRALR